MVRGCKLFIADGKDRRRVELEHRRAWSPNSSRQSANVLDSGTGSNAYPVSVSSSWSTNRPLYSGELARLAGVSADTVRFYDRRGLLPVVARSASGYRIFPQDTLARVQLIQSALSIGFSVNDLAGIFRERDRGAAPCRHVRALAAEKLAVLEARLRDLQSWRRELLKTLAEWDRMLAKTPRGKPARLLETFAATHPKSHARKLNFYLQVHPNRKRGIRQ